MISTDHNELDSRHEMLTRAFSRQSKIASMMLNELLYKASFRKKRIATTTFRDEMSRPLYRNTFARPAKPGEEPDFEDDGTAWKWEDTRHDSNHLASSEMHVATGTAPPAPDIGTLRAAPRSFLSEEWGIKHRGSVATTVMPRSLRAFLRKRNYSDDKINKIIKDNFMAHRADIEDALNEPEELRSDDVRSFPYDSDAKKVARRKLFGIFDASKGRVRRPFHGGGKHEEYKVGHLNTDKIYPEHVHRRPVYIFDHKAHKDMTDHLDQTGRGFGKNKKKVVTEKGGRLMGTMSIDTESGTPFVHVTHYIPSEMEANEEMTGATSIATPKSDWKFVSLLREHPHAFVVGNAHSHPSRSVPWGSDADLLSTAGHFPHPYNLMVIHGANSIHAPGNTIRSGQEFLSRKDAETYLRQPGAAYSRVPLTMNIPGSLFLGEKPPLGEQPFTPEDTGDHSVPFPENAPMFMPKSSGDGTVTSYFNGLHFMTKHFPEPETKMSPMARMGFRPVDYNVMSRGLGRVEFPNQIQILSPHATSNYQGGEMRALMSQIPFTGRQAFRTPARIDSQLIDSLYSDAENGGPSVYTGRSVKRRRRAEYAAQEARRRGMSAPTTSGNKQQDISRLEHETVNDLHIDPRVVKVEGNKQAKGPMIEPPSSPLPRLGKSKPWESAEAKDAPNHARSGKKWAAARAAATRKYGTKNSYVKNQYAARIYGEKGGKWEAAAKSQTPAWTRAEGKNPKGGLNAAGRASARAEGHNLRPPVKSGKTLSDIKRRYSFLSRMSGNPGPEHDEKGKPTRLLLSLQVWGASSKADAKRKAAMLQRKIERMEGSSHGSD